MEVQANQLVWWHFSDFHWRAEGSAERERYIDTLFGHLARTLSSHGSPDFVILSGDLTFSGKDAEYASFKLHFIDRLNTLLKWEGQEVNRYHMVPGNHDVERSAVRLINPHLITSIRSPADVDALLSDNDTVNVILQPFRAFHRFCESLYGTTLPNTYTLSWTRTLSLRGFTVRISGANSAWASSYHRDSQGGPDDLRHLWVSPSQVSNETTIGPTPDLSIFLMHHPLHWLSNASEHLCRQHIHKTFDVLLTGHVHSAERLQNSITPAGQCISIPAPVLHDNADTDTITYARGYAVVSFDMKAMAGGAHFYKYSNSFGDKITPFLDLYGEGLDHFPLSIQREAKSPFPIPLSESMSELLSSAGHLSQITEAVSDSVGFAPQSDRTVLMFDQMAMELLTTLGIVERDTASSAIEAILIVRSLLTLHVSDILRHSDKYQPHRASNAFRMIVDKLAGASAIDTLLLPRDQYLELAAWSLNGQPIRDNRAKQLPEPYLRYFSISWILGQVCLLLNHPSAAKVVFADDVRVIGLIRRDAVFADDNILSFRVDDKSHHVFVETRVANRDGFLLATTTKHFIDAFLREMEELWRRHQRVFPSLAFTLLFPKWSGKAIEGEYLAVEATPIIRLLMGKGLYRDTLHVWFRELVQNALDANVTRRALSDATYLSRIEISLITPNECAIRDNGIGMSHQHITRYLTTLGRSIWSSDELDEKASPNQRNRAIGKFGIGFASVFEHAERVFVYTRFFRDIGEVGWQVDFTSIDKPFFIERHPTEIGTEVRLHLKTPINPDEFVRTAKEFFVYADDTIVFSPPAVIPQGLDHVKMVDHDLHSSAEIAEGVTEHVIGPYRFRVKAAFVVCGHKDKKGPPLPGSFLIVSNSGVRVFSQASEYIKPGKRYIVKEYEENTGRTYYDRDVDSISHYYVIVDFERGYSPIMPSRNEIDISQEFSTELRNILHKLFAGALRSSVTRVAASDLPCKAKRDGVLSRLTESHSAFPGSRSYGRSKRRILDSAHEYLFRETQGLYSDYCPLCVQSGDGSVAYHTLAEIRELGVSVYVYDEIAKSALFLVYVRSRGIDKWIVATSRGEFQLLSSLLPEVDFKGISETRDIYADRAQLLNLREDSPLTRFIRGDYAITESDVFGEAAFLCLPANLPGSWKRAQSASCFRSDVAGRCPPRVLLNGRHPLFLALEAAASLPDQEQVRLRQFQMLIDAMSDGVIEQERIGVARERWRKLRSDICDITGVAAIGGMTYEALSG